MTLFRSLLLSFAAVASAPAHAIAAPRKVPLHADAFDLTLARSVFERRVGGRDALCLDGPVFLKQVRLRSGVISVDVANERRRHFANILFRGADTRNYEQVYARMHKSRQPDALQYTPELGGATNWQLFIEEQAGVDFGDALWVTLEVAFNSDRARFSVRSDVDEAHVLVDDLVLPDARGLIGLGALQGACFSNFQYDDAAPEIQIADQSADAPDGLIREWGLSQSRAFETFPMRIQNSIGAWENVATQDNGLLLIGGHREQRVSGSFEDNSLDVVDVGVVITSRKKRDVALSFDLSDQGAVYLNGRRLHRYDNTFRRKGLTYRGDVLLGAQSLTLPLKRGRNELIVSIAERANGWGVIAALEDSDGLTIEPLE